MVKFEIFKLYELKDILVYVKSKFGALTNYSQYNINKYDLIVVLRNSGYFEESNRTHLIFKYKKHTVDFFPDNINRLFRGLKNDNITIEKKKIIISFN